MSRTRAVRARYGAGGARGGGGAGPRRETPATTAGSAGGRAGGERRLGALPLKPAPAPCHQSRRITLAPYPAPEARGRFGGPRPLALPPRGGGGEVQVPGLATHGSGGDPDPGEQDLWPGTGAGDALRVEGVW